MDACKFILKKDISKQMVSSLLIHFMNLLLAVMLSKQNEDDACVWYLINCLLDTFVGVIFQWILVRLIEVIARRKKIETLVSGCYYSRNTTEFDDLNIDYTIWAVQCGLWCIICAWMKMFIYFIMITFGPSLDKFGTSLLQSVSEYPRLELVIVMVIVPFILNCIQVNTLYNLVVLASG
jgi:hypothetical protein